MSAGAGAIVSRTEPVSVNLNAFESRFFSTCWRRCSSVEICSGAPGASSIANSRPFSSATGLNERSTKSRTDSSSVRPACTSIFPASTLDRSRMSLISASRSEPALWIVDAASTCFAVRLPTSFDASTFDRISSELSGVRSSCDMFARNSDLYFELSASCSAFSSSELRAISISRFLISMSRFWRSSCSAFSWSSSFVACSSSCWDWSACDCSCSSCDWDCDCWSSSSVRTLAMIVESTTPIVSVSWSRNWRMISLKGVNEASSITASTCSSNRTGITMMFVGRALPSPDAICT